MVCLRSRQDSGPLRRKSKTPGFVARLIALLRTLNADHGADRMPHAVKRYGGSDTTAYEAMSKIRIVISRDGPSQRERVVIREVVVETESDKRLTATRAARLLARSCPGFARTKGRYARAAGVEVLPVVEPTENGWRAWRLETGDDSPSGWQPPIPGRVGKSNSANNPFAERAKGNWFRADISEW